ncbi:hypothetical protein [Lawsonella clevelandensis]|uniref:hypothetical protein n=1 Tax=Lawsonella clevelandensis TaxID=1528099 RepID=UPI0006B5973E|nr:hypothetical protein [Lawsonella clevelandensis]ALE34500.1 hypothetical protein IY73_03045 [Lawsonella clevelandensis]
MASLVCGSRSVLAWHMQVQAAHVGRTLEVVDPLEFLPTIPTDDDIDVIVDDGEEVADDGDDFFSDSADDGTPLASEEELAAAGSEALAPVVDTPAITSADEPNGAEADTVATDEVLSEPAVPLGAAEPQQLPPFHYDSLIYLADARLWSPPDPTHAPTDEELAQEIRTATDTVVEILETLPTMPETIVLASSISAGNTTEVGQALAEAGVLVEQATSGYAARYMELQFPQIFGEGFPSLKGALISQLCAAVATGKHPRVSQDRPMTIMYAQEAARILTSEMPDFAMSMAESSKEPTGELAIILNEIGQMAVDGRIPDHIDSSRYELLFQLYSTLRAAQLRALSAGRHVLPQLPTATVVTELPQVTSRVHLVAPGETLELVGVLEGLHRVAVLSGTAELTLPSFPEVVLVAATGELPEKDQPSIAQELAEELTEEPLHKDPQGMPFLDMPHGYTLQLAAVGDSSVVVAEWVSEP